MTVIATGFDKAPGELPKMAGGQVAAEQAAFGAHTAKAPEPIDPEAEKKAVETEDDPFEDIFKIFNKRD